MHQTKDLRLKEVPVHEGRAKEQREMLSKIATGDEVATAGGILGKVVEVGEQFLTLEIASGVNVKLQKFQVAQVLPKGTVKSA